MYIVISHNKDMTSGVLGPFPTREEASAYIVEMKKFAADGEYFWNSVVKIDSPKNMKNTDESRMD